MIFLLFYPKIAPTPCFSNFLPKVISHPLYLGQDDQKFMQCILTIKFSINRFAMVSQSLMVPMEIGDQFYVLLHEGALKGGGISHTFTSLNGHKIATMAIPEEHNDL